MPKDIDLKLAHDICDQIEVEIQTKLPESNVTIHVEPCNEECEQCFMVCSRRNLK